jgi:tetratricopeptide (TPR) repeat protein
MGRKQNWRRKYLLFLVAGLTFFLLGGCASFEKFLEEFSRKKSLTEERTPSVEGTAEGKPENKSEMSRLYLLEAKKLFLMGQYEGAFREYEKAAVLLKKNPPADEALFFMGLIKTYPENPRKDLGRSIQCMKSVIADFPLGPFVAPARAWIGLLMENERLGKASEKSIQEKENLMKEQEKLSRAHEKLVKDHEKLIKENEKLNKMLEELKQVDIEMEGKKREKGR